MRSRTGCLTCRQRKLKCDEKKPVCGQCIKASRECVPSSGIVFRHQHNASMNGDDSGDDNSLKGFYAYKNTFEEDTIWMDIPKNVTFINTTNPYLDPGTPDFETMSVTSMDSPPQRVAQPLSSWRTQSSFPSVTSTPSNMGPDLVPVSIPMSYTPELESLPPLSQSPSISLAGTPVSPPPSYLSNRIHPIINYSHSHSATPPPIDPCLPNYISRPASVSSARRSPARSEPDFGESDREITFLLRWFQESPGSWMDLFDLGTYFTSNIPAMAAESPLIKYAAVACAAKSLARLNGCKPALTGVPPQGHLELYPGSSLVDWKHKAAVYYDNAVSLLLHALKTEPTITPDDSDCEFGPDSFNSRSPKRRRTSSNTSVVTSSDDLLAASAILCVYEFLDSSMSEWAKHLDGAKSLLVLTQDQMTPFQLPTPTSSISSGSFNFISKTRKATFWNIARQDMQAALIHQTHTRLDTENLSLWQDAGLVIDDQGFIMPSTKTECGFLEESEIIDTCCNTLVWLMSKLVNFVATGDASTPTGGSWTHVPQRTTLDNWRNLQQQFQVWYDGLPAAFQPSARVPSNPDGSFMKSGMDPIFSEVWYSMPMCAATMQTYHMSQILLFMNKPHEATQGQNSVCAQLNSYQSVLASCQKHSREIVGISLARPDEAVRIHSVQPLFTAGQCLNNVRERQVVLDLLRGLESEIGWATNTRVQQLVQQWHWEEQEVRVP